MENIEYKKCLKCENEATKFHKYYFIDKKEVEILKKTNVRVNNTGSISHYTEIKGVMLYDPESVVEGNTGFCTECLTKMKTKYLIGLLIGLGLVVLFAVLYAIVPGELSENGKVLYLLGSIIGLCVGFIFSVILFNVWDHFARQQTEVIATAFRKTGVRFGYKEEEENDLKRKGFVHNKATRILTTNLYNSLKKKDFIVKFMYHE